MESTLEDLKTRRSIRSFSDKRIEKDVLDKILEAGTYAPTGMGRQSPKIVVVRDKDTIQKMSNWNKMFFPNNGSKEMQEALKDANPFYDADTLVIVLADENCPTCVDDGNLVIGNILNAAHALGVGGCYIYRAREEFDTEQGKELLKVWGIPENYRGIGHVVLGYPASDVQPSPAPRKNDYIVYVD